MNTPVNAQLKLTTAGNLGINTSNPLSKLHVEGTTRISNWTDVFIDWTGLLASPVIYPENNWYLTLGKPDKRLYALYTYTINPGLITWWSDSSLKTDIETIEDPMDKISNLSGKQYYFSERFLDSIPDSGRAEFLTLQYGFIAQDVAQVLPNIVSTDSVTGLLSLNYIAIIPILTEALKAQQSQITDLQNQVNFLSSQLDACCPGSGLVRKQPQKNNTGEGKMYKGSSALHQGSELNNIPTLFQNTPNPFNESCEIKYFIPATTKNALLVIYNLNGQQMRSYKLANSGLQSLKIDGGELSAGSYYYTLLVDNAEVDTKKMILYK